MLVARLNRQRIIEAAGHLGIARKRFSEVCQELLDVGREGLPEDYSPVHLSPDDFHWVLAAFVEECVLPPQKVTDALAALA